MPVRVCRLFSEASSRLRYERNACVQPLPLFILRQMEGARGVLARSSRANSRRPVRIQWVYLTEHPYGRVTGVPTVSPAIASRRAWDT